MAKHSTIFANEVGFFFDDRRRLARLEGTTPIVVSTPFDKTIQALTTITDTTMDYVTVDGRNFLLIAFPTEDRTLLYDVQGDYWAEWSRYDAASDKRRRFSGNVYAYARGWNKHLFGQVNNSTIFEMVNTVYQDNGVDIHFVKTTGNIDFGAPNRRKRMYKMTMLLKTGVGLGAGGNTVPYLLVRWKDNNENEWSNWRYVSLQISGKTKAIVSIPNLGSFYSRKFQFKMTENVPFTIGKAYGELDISEF
jgi:hypothetical protein